VAEGDYVEGLTGEEIINDVLDQLGRKLHGDCNLRETDAYPGGYEGEIEYHLRLRGMDTAEVKATVIVGSPRTGLNENAEVKTADGRVEIALEPELNVVRQRSDQGVPTLSKDENGHPIVKKRHYQRRSLAENEDQAETIAIEP
jgi:hypothetical protein